MKTITKVSKLCFFLNLGLVITLGSILHPAHAELLVIPTIVITPSTVFPNCHTYTGCGVTVVKRSYIYQRCAPRLPHYRCRDACPTGGDYSDDD